MRKWSLLSLRTALGGMLRVHTRLTTLVCVDFTLLKCWASQTTCCCKWDCWSSGMTRASSAKALYSVVVCLYLISGCLEPALAFVGKKSLYLAVAHNKLGRKLRVAHWTNRY